MKIQVYKKPYVVASKTWKSFFNIHCNNIFTQREFLKTIFKVRPLFKFPQKEIDEVWSLGFSDTQTNQIRYWKAYDKEAYDKEELCQEKKYDKRVYSCVTKTFDEQIYRKWESYVDEYIAAFKSAKPMFDFFYNCNFYMYEKEISPKTVIKKINNFRKDFNAFAGEFNLEVENILNKAINN